MNFKEVKYFLSVSHQSKRKRDNMKRYLSIITATLLLFSCFIYAHAEDPSTLIEDNSIAIDLHMQQTIDQYFQVRSAILNGGKTESAAEYVKLLFDLTPKTEVCSTELNRMNAVDNLARYHNVHLLNSTNSASVQSVTEIHSSVYDVSVYEWTWIDYNDGNGGHVDRLGYATEHQMTLAEQSDGGYLITADIYDESDILGVPNIELETMDISPVEPPAANIQGTNSGIDLKVNNVIDYADKWVVHQYTSNPVVSAYNTYNYGYYSGADCANFVSQCLKAGGMNFDYGNGADYDSASQWWYDLSASNKNNNYTICPPAWRRVSYMIPYWTSQGYSHVSATSSNIFPGNPVISSGSHVGICVGYNAAGIPIVNAHTRDVYHVPYTMLGSSITTIQITTNNQMLYTAALATPITPTSANTQVQKYLGSDDSHFFKFTVSSAGTYTFKSTSYSATTLDTKATIYKESVTSNGTTLYLYEVVTDDDSGDSTNFLIQQYLEPGTYYIRVRAFATGNYYFNYKLG